MDLRAVRRSTLLVISVLLCGAVESSSVFGTILDPAGYPLPQVSIRLSELGGMWQYATYSDSNGQFRVNDVPPGSYKITMSLQGFQPSVRNLRIRANKDIDIGVVSLGFAPCNTPAGPICDSFGLPERTCPDPSAVDFLKHQIAYQRTWDVDPVRGLSLIHMEVWMRGTLTGFYIRERLRGFAPNVRDTYIFDENGPTGAGTCAADKNWQRCIEDFVGEFAPPDQRQAITCSTSINTHSIPRWEPSPNDGNKRQIVRDLRREIESIWDGAQEIVVRDFNLKDNQIIIYLKMPDGEHYQGCGFHAARHPHCDWHLFGQAPISALRKSIFDRPYRLK